MARHLSEQARFGRASPALSRSGLPVLRAVHDNEVAADRVLETAAGGVGVDGAEGAAQSICESVIAAFPQHLPGYLALAEHAEYLTDRALHARQQDGVGRLEGALANASGCFLNQRSVRILVEAARLALREFDPDHGEQLAARAVWLRPDYCEAVELLHHARAAIAKDNVTPLRGTCDELGACIKHGRSFHSID